MYGAEAASVLAGRSGTARRGVSGMARGSTPSPTRPRSTPAANRSACSATASAHLSRGKSRAVRRMIATGCLIHDDPPASGVRAFAREASSAARRRQLGDETAVRDHAVVQRAIYRGIDDAEAVAEHADRFAAGVERGRVGDGVDPRPCRSPPRALCHSPRRTDAASHRTSCDPGSHERHARRASSVTSPTRRARRRFRNLLEGRGKSGSPASSTRAPNL